MKKRLFRMSTLMVLMLLISSIILASCASSQGATTAPAIAPTLASSSAPQFRWPDTLHFAATGSSGEAKMVSWASVMQSELKGPIIRVVNEAAWTNTYKDMAKNQMVLTQIDKSTLRDCIEAISEYAMLDGGPWMGGLVWVDSLAATGFMVRGNSSINKPEDIKPGTKIAIWNDKSATLNPFRSLLAWGSINEKDIIWVNTGDYDAGPRAVAEGRADIAMAAPVSPAVMEASAAPNGVRYISLNPGENPEGAKRFLQTSPLYDFGPITVGPKSAIGTWAIVSYKYIGANMSTDTDLIYNLAKWLDQNYDKYKDRYESNKNMTFGDVLTALQTAFILYIPVW
jgi:ABC-type amino acid transport substrate-binding protein